jgi:hypothetical protein
MREQLWTATNDLRLAHLAFVLVAVFEGHEVKRG